MANMSVTLCGVELANPLIVSSGPLSYGAAGIRRCFTAGAAAAVTKTLRREAAVNPTPHIIDLGKGMMLNTEKWSDLNVDRWVDAEFPALEGALGVVIASVGHTVQDVEAILPRLEGLSAIKLIELVSYAGSDMAPMVRAAKRVSRRPTLAKVSPNWPDLYDVVDACAAAGADGITAADSLGPTLHVDIETARPSLESHDGYAWLSGTAIRPLIVRIVADICRRHPALPVVATGGVSDASDVIEMSMVGATAIGVHTAPMLRGVGWFRRTNAGASHWLDEHGYASLAETRGLALPAMAGGEDRRPLRFRYDADSCSDCKRCVAACAYEARRLEDKQMALDEAACRSCGLCVSVCPTAALRAAKE